MNSATKLNDYFDLREFIPQSVFEKFGLNFCLRFVNPVMLNYATWLRQLLQEHYGCEVAIRINDWHYGGTFQNRAYRPPSSTIGKWTSAHRLAMALDMSFTRKDTGATIPIKEVFALVMANEAEAMKIGITRIEDIADTPTWLHTDCSYTALNHIQIVKP